MYNRESLEGCRIVASDGQPLGTISRNVVDPSSIYNVVGAYGSVVSPTSIFNVVGVYGSVVGALSPFNVVCANPPVLVSPNGQTIGFLTKNVTKVPRVDPDVLRIGNPAAGLGQAETVTGSTDAIVPLYDRRGRAVAYIYEGQYVYLYSGKPVAWLSDEHLYAYNGTYLGWLESGWVRDRQGHCVFFTTEATGGPAKPARGARPARGAKGARPARGARQARPARPAKSSVWAASSGEAFFMVA